MHDYFETADAGGHSRRAILIQAQALMADRIQAYGAAIRRLKANQYPATNMGARARRADQVLVESERDDLREQGQVVDSMIQRFNQRAVRAGVVPIR